MAQQICIITGSTLGGAEYIGDHLCDLLEQQDFITQVENHASLANVEGQKLWLVVTSTHGAGELPDNLKPLFQEIKDNDTDLSEVRFAVVGLGNSDYDTFCQAVDKVETTLNKQGAKQICKSLRIDVLTIEDHEQAAEDWLPNFVNAL
ncbi:FMN-binding protein MioC [Mannheimia massilioguelmaensis]|uniref:FMN-binding protein MioC n=1 Tax=Mannheimia massilioguelmaensis TaxID=1604354 RepID=UPI0005CB1CDC|nr:FMN-binding protein MioC [Mannheimia massilioguelmaensis]